MNVKIAVGLSVKSVFCAGMLFLSSVSYSAEDNNTSKSNHKNLEQWVLITNLWGNPVYQTLSLEIDGENVSGNLDGDSLTGHKNDAGIEFVVEDNQHAIYSYKGKLNKTTITGTADMPDTNNNKVRALHEFTARKIPTRPSGAARKYDFKPNDYSNSFDPNRLPVLTVWPGDSISTTTIDSGGVDKNGITQALYGNPQTGPFFIATAEPGDTLVVKLNRIRLNRDYADSLDSIVNRALGSSLVNQSNDLGKPVRWKLDLERGLASLENPSDQLKDFKVPVKPMLGGLGVAPGNGMPAISAGDTGRFGGNMDFNAVVEGNTVYFNVQQPGALLYLGDAHALQGDGETSQYALETSMDVEFTVDIVKGKLIMGPRIESPTQIMVLGQAGSLDEALKSASTGLIQWLQQDYGLTLSECAIILGSSMQYTVANLAGRSVGVVAKLDKALLKSIPQAKTAGIEH